MADIAPMRDPRFGRDVAGLAVVGTIYTLTCELTSPGGDPFDSELWKWGWLLLPLTAALVGAIRLTTSGAYSGALIGPQAVYTVLFGAVFYDEREGASFWMISLLFIGVLFALTAAAQTIGDGLGRRESAPALRGGLVIVLGVALTAAAIDVTPETVGRVAAASRCDAAWDRADAAERERPGYPEHYAATFRDCDPEGWRRNTVDREAVIDLGGPGFQWYCAHYARGGTCAGLVTRRAVQPTLGVVEEATCEQFLQAPYEEQAIVAAAIESRARQKTVSPRYGTALVPLREACEQRSAGGGNTIRLLEVSAAVIERSPQ